MRPLSVAVPLLPAGGLRIALTAPGTVIGGVFNQGGGAAGCRRRRAGVFASNSADTGGRVGFSTTLIGGVTECLAVEPQAVSAKAAMAAASAFLVACNRMGYLLFDMSGFGI